MPHPVIDLHCDLLSYLAADEQRTPDDLAVPCALPFLEEGGVKLQTLAIFTETGEDSVELGTKQGEIYQTLEAAHPGKFVCALENLSGVCDESEPLEKGLERLVKLMPLLYITFTWNTANRFGGGNKSSVGLTEDGKRLLEFLSGRGVAVDLSHTSDQMAYDLLNEIDRMGYQIPVLASHSNFRAVTPVARNLPDELAEEVFRRGGIIGLNVIHYFVGMPFEKHFVKQLEHGVKLGGAKQLCLGADFFMPTNRLTFAKNYETAQCYPRLLGLAEGIIDAEDLASQNFERWRKRC